MDSAPEGCVRRQRVESGNMRVRTSHLPIFNRALYQLSYIALVPALLSEWRCLARPHTFQEAAALALVKHCCTAVSRPWRAGY